MVHRDGSTHAGNPDNGEAHAAAKQHSNHHQSRRTFLGGNDKLLPGCPFAHRTILRQLSKTVETAGEVPKMLGGRKATFATSACLAGQLAGFSDSPAATRT